MSFCSTPSSSAFTITARPTAVVDRWVVARRRGRRAARDAGAVRLVGYIDARELGRDLLEVGSAGRSTRRGCRRAGSGRTDSPGHDIGRRARDPDWGARRRNSSAASYCASFIRRAGAPARRRSRHPDGRARHVHDDHGSDASRRSASHGAPASRPACTRPDGHRDIGPLLSVRAGLNRGARHATA